ncbi:cytochrome ubiquinol oxidase subunit I [Streptomyces sp. NPDC088341]|uniref:cytochrome ubiquinol oxidase subunit I n=1 Tax=Streptomyces sp. NPDC088341 TaxID=3154870 RepID=UPI0034403BE5
MASPAVVEISRWQFAVTAVFHMSFPALTVGLSVFLAVMYTVHPRTGNPLYLQIFRFEVDGQFRASDWWHVLFNPAFSYRYPHILLAVLISASWFIGGIAAWYLVKQRAPPFARRTLSIALGVLAILMPVQLYVGDSTAAFMGEHQPAKLQAFEGNWKTDNNGYNLLVVPNTDKGRNEFQVAIPHLGAVIGKDLSGKANVPGLLQTPKDERPNMWSAFYGFRLMYFSALVMFGMAFAGLVLRLRGRLYTARRFYRLMVWMTPAGVLAVSGGWITAETGRQPWVVYGLIRTGDAVSHLSLGAAIAGLTGFVTVYALLLGIWPGRLRHRDDEAQVEEELQRGGADRG